MQKRRACLSIFLCSLALAAQAQSTGPAWPSRPIRFVVPFAAGGANDLMARAAAEGASAHLGQTIVIDNKPGAGSTLGADIVAKSAPDGYTFLISGAGVISNGMIKKNMPFKDSDLVPVAMIALSPSIITVPAHSKYNTLREFVEASKSSSGFFFATAGTGSTPHFVAEMLNTHYGAKIVPVPYKSGSESTTALMSGQVQGTSEASIVSLPHLQHGGKIKALATTWTRRIAAYPDLPTAVEQGFKEVQIAHWAGVHAPAGVSPEIMDKLAAAVDASMKNPAIVARLRPLGIEPIGGTRASFNDFVNAERARLGAVARASRMKED